MGSARPWPGYRLAYRLLIADEHRVVAEGLKLMLASVCDSILIVGSGEELVHTVRRSPPSVVVCEFKLPGLSGLEAMKVLHGEGYGTPFLFLTMHDNTVNAVAAYRGGARGFVSKSSVGEDLIHAIEVVAAGRTHMSADLAARAIGSRHWESRQLAGSRLRVLQLTAAGYRVKEIAHLLGLSKRTIESHKYWLMRDLNVHNTLHLLEKAKEEGLI